MIVGYIRQSTNYGYVHIPDEEDDEKTEYNYYQDRKAKDFEQENLKKEVRQN